MKRLLTILLFFPVLAMAQSETHVFSNYDTTFTLGGYEWIAAIDRPTGLFGSGADTAARPMIIMVPGQGQMGSANYSNLSVYGPMYWLANGWDGSVVLGNGTHYPIIITLTAATNTYPSAVYYYQAAQYLITHYHAKLGSVYGTGLSEGSFAQGSLIEFEDTIGNQKGMKLLKAVAMFEGTPQTSYYSSPGWPTPYPNNTWADTPYFATWARTYGGKMFYLEGSGSDNFRDGWHYTVEMNSAVPNSAYFSYEDIGGGAHCCWNTMYDPSQTNWTSVGTLGPNNSPSQLGTNTMGDYIGGNVYQWMLRQGDTSLVGSGASPPTVTASASPSTITLPTSSTSLSGSATPVSPATSISTYAWTQTSGPNAGTFSNAAMASPTFSGLIAGSYVLNLAATDNNGNIGNASVTITVNSAPTGCRAFTWDSTNANILLTGTSFGASPAIHRCDTIYILPSQDTAGYRSISVQGLGLQNDPNPGNIYIRGKHQTHIKIKSFPGPGNEFANNWGNDNWIEVDSLIMLNHTDPVISNPYYGNTYSHHMFFNGGNTTQSFFASGDITQSASNFSGDTVNCMFDWHWTHWRFDSGIGDTVVSGVPGGPAGGNTYIWLGALAKNGIWIGAEIDHSHMLNNASDSAPATDIHMENCFYCLLDYDTLENMGVVQHPVGHASITFGKLSMIVEHNLLFKGNFGNTLTSRGLGDIPSMYPFFRYWAALKGDTGYNGLSLYYNNRDSGSRKYPGVETENDPGDTVYNSFYRSRPALRVLHNTFARMNLGAGNKYYYNSALDCYGGPTDSIYFHNNSWTAAISDTVVSCPFDAGQGGCLMISYSNGVPLHIDTAGNSQTYTMATSGLDSNTFVPILGGPLYLNASPATPVTTIDFLGHSRSPTGPVSKGSTEYFAILPSCTNCITFPIRVTIH